ncbi:hypothetical protein BpHYR1_005927 [Brachionus plicatilis]|uniref:Uncharacterized protein n=1 Tax=Brachionus plicatilis TaxID=10195 RepID=A0A3M7S2V7_BRAPC|nr:hypothetical protein BpHYR1_005927 [Brachionus plicatilis]
MYPIYSDDLIQVFYEKLQKLDFIIFVVVLSITTRPTLANLNVHCFTVQYYDLMRLASRIILFARIISFLLYLCYNCEPPDPEENILLKF